MGNLIKDSDVLLEIIDHLVCRADFQVLFAVDYERGEDGGKQTSLWDQCGIIDQDGCVCKVWAKYERTNMRTPSMSSFSV